jgi:DNA-directed RNA polymerase subunit RPC12/RpoP
MSKIKMRCSQCGKSFKSSSARQLICPECEEKARRERLAKAKGPQPGASTPPPAPTRQVPAKAATPAARPEQPKQHWLVQERDVKVAAPAPKETARPPRLDTPVKREIPAPTFVHPAFSGPIKPSASAPATSARTAPAAPPAQRGGPAPAQKRGGEPPRSSAKTAAPRKPEGEKRAKGSAAAQPHQRPKREPRPPTPPFTPTAEQIAAIEKRYLELAQPHEYDGLRTQIAKELGIPKTAVKQIVIALRERLHLPSWWELQPYHGSSEDKERIRQAYLATLPLPPVGVHKQIAEELHLSAGVVYQAIKAIRSEMNLPAYNPPEAHGLLPPASQTATPSQ